MIRPALLLALTATPAMADDVTVFAAASLKNALDEVAAGFSRDTGHTVTISYAGSNALAKQIIEGGDKTAAEEQLRVASRKLDKAVTKGVFHRNSAANKKSNMARALNKLG